MKSSFLIEDTSIDSQQTPFDAALDSPDAPPPSDAGPAPFVGHGAAATASYVAAPASSAISGPVAASGSGLVINATIGAGAPAGFASAVAAAVAYFEHTFTNSLTMNITFNWASLGGNAIAQTSSFIGQYSYSSVRTALLANNSGLTIPTTDPFPAGDTTKYELSTPANTLWLTNGQATALGLSTVNSGSNTNQDGTITLNSNLSYNFDSTVNGVADEYNAAPTLEHEISEMMGRSLGGNNSSGNGLLPTALALFRYNSVSHAIDTSDNVSNDYFSINGGTTNLRSNMGESGGDLADWGDTTSDVAGYGTTGTTQYYTPVDIQALNAVGWTVSTSDYWLGQTADWTTASDWSNGVPTGSSVVIIQQGDPGISSAANAASIEVQSGAALSIGSTLSLGSAGLTLDGGSTVHFSAIESTNFAVHLAGAATIDTGATSFNDDVIGGVISGSGSISTTGGSNLELDGANSFTGGVNANGIAWVALLGSANGLGSGALTLSSSELILGINATVSNTIYLAGSDAIFVDASKTTTLSGIIADSGGAGALRVDGPGVLALTGANTYSGGTTVFNGSTVSISAANNLGSGSVTLDAGATLKVTQEFIAHFGISLAGNATIDSSGTYSDFQGQISGAGSLTLLTSGGSPGLETANTYTGGTTATGGGRIFIDNDDALGTGALTLDHTGFAIWLSDGLSNNISLDGVSNFDVLNPTLTGVISDGSVAGGIFVSSGTLTLTGANTYSGGTEVGDGATLAISADDNVGKGSVTLDAGATLKLDQGLVETFAIVLNGAATIDSTGFYSNFEGVISGSGPLTLLTGSGGSPGLETANTYSGGTTATGGGRIFINDDEALGTGALTLDHTGIYLALSDTVANNISIDGVVAFAGDSPTLSGIISDGSVAGGIVDSASSLKLTGANTYSGGTEVQYGATLSISDDESLGTGTLTLDGGATLKIASYVGLNNAISLAGAATIDSTGLYSNFFGAISGSGSLTLLTGSGGSPGLRTANSYSGGTTATGGGRVYISNDDALGTGALTLDHTGLFLAVTDTIANNIAIDGTVDIGGSSPTLSGIISDGSSAGGIVLTSGDLTLTAANTFSGGAEVQSGATLAISDDASLGTGALTLDGGATLKVVSYVAIGNAITLAGNATIDSTGEYSNFDDTISGSGSLTLITTGGGSPGLNAANTYAGGTTATGGGRIYLSNNQALGTGVLTLNQTGVALAFTGVMANNVSIDGVVGFDDATPTLSGIVSDGAVAGGIDLFDGGLTLTGANTYSGGTTIAGGTTLTISGAGTLGLGGVTVASNGTLSIGAGSAPTIKGTSDFEGTVSGGGTLKLGAGTVTIGSSATISVANWTLAGANVTINEALTYTGPFTMGAGSVLGLSGGILALMGATTLSGGATAGSQRLQLKAATSVTGAVTIGGSSGLSNFAAMTLTGAGTLTLGDSSGAAVSFNNTATGTVNFTTNNGVKLGVGANSAISNSGLIEKTGGTGVTVIAASLSGAGEIKAQTGTLELAGASNLITGKLDGAGKIFLSGGVTTLGAGATVSAPTFTLLGGGTALRLQTNLSYGAAFTVSSGASVVLNAADTLTLTGTSSLFGAISGGTLAMTGGASTIVTTATFAMANWTSSGVALGMTGQHIYGGKFSASAETITFNAFLRLNGATTLTGVKLAGSGQLQLENATTIASGLTLGGTTSASNFGTVTQSGGNVVLGDSSNGVAKIANNGAAATWNFAGDYGITLGNSAASTVGNTGVIEKSSGSGVSAIAAAVANGGKLEALSGTLDIEGAVTGKGSDIVSGASTLEFDGSVAGAQTIQFQGAGSTLDLTNWGAFSGAISDFDAGGATNDAIDVLGPWSYVGFNQGTGMLTFADGMTQHSVHLAGSYLAADFHTNPISGGGTQVTYV